MASLAWPSQGSQTSYMGLRALRESSKRQEVETASLFRPEPGLALNHLGCVLWVKEGIKSAPDSREDVIDSTS